MTGFWNLAPSELIVSPTRSVAGVVAHPVKRRAPSSTALTWKAEYPRVSFIATSQEEHLDGAVFLSLLRHYADSHSEGHHAVDAVRALGLHEFAVAGRVTDRGRVIRAHGQHRVAAVPELLCQQARLKLADGGRHRDEALPELDELLQLGIGESGTLQPWAKVPHVEAVEGDGLHVVIVEHAAKLMRDVFVLDGSAGRGLQIALIGPHVIWHPVSSRLLGQTLFWEPECWHDR